MRIRWSPVAVMDAAGKMDKLTEQIVAPLAEMRKIAEEAKKIPNLPQYVEWRFNAIGIEGSAPKSCLARSMASVSATSTNSQPP